MLNIPGPPVWAWTDEQRQQAGLSRKDVGLPPKEPQRGPLNWDKIVIWAIVLWAIIRLLGGYDSLF